MAINDCRILIKDKIPDVQILDLDRNEIDESGVFLLYEGFDVADKILVRKFGLYVAGVVYDAKFNFDETLSKIESKFNFFGVAEIVTLESGQLVSFSPDGFVIFRYEIKVRDFDVGT